MTSSSTRLGVLSAVFLGGVGVVLIHLWFLMVHNEEVWARRSYENRWAFRSVPSQRGSLRDRDGVVLAADASTTRVSIYYHRFRLRHVVGAAVHGATHWANLRSARAGTTYTYLPGVLGPRVAAEDLLNVPVRALQPGVLSKSQFADLVTYATTVLSVCSDLTRAQSFAAMREAAVSGRDVGIGDVLPMPRVELLRRFQERLQGLRELDRRLAAEQQKHAERMGRTEVPDGLIATLELLRRQSLDDVHSTWTDGQGVVHVGSAKEDIRRYFANDVDFELAAALRVDRSAHPGLDVEPAVRRERLGGRDTSLGVILGQVRSHDRLVQPRAQVAAGQEALAPRKTWVERYLESEMREDWLGELVPENVVANEHALQKMREEAERRYQRDMHVFERRGISGMESLCNEDLMGVLGMRFVEHDSRRREQLLWSHLRVRSGEDVQVTIDLELQRAAEIAVRNADARYRGAYTDAYDLERLEAAFAVIDAHTGDVLAVAGAPIRDQDQWLRVPGFSWLANGSVGSVVKPFVLLEHLESERFGRPHTAVDRLRACNRVFRYGGTTLRCDHTHWEEGRDPVSALAKSCNLFFFQVGDGLGEDGLARALQRFGLLEAGPGDLFGPCWQRRVPGLPMAKTQYDPGRLLPSRSIGYGVEAAPLMIARAYAALATGSLPTLGLRLGEARPPVPLGDIGSSLAIVRRGLKECVQGGTARKLDRLKELRVHGKTGTAEVTSSGQNNGWFAGYLPWSGRDGIQLSFCAVVYRIPNGEHGADAAGQLVVDFLQQMEAAPQLVARYLTPQEGR